MKAARGLAPSLRHGLPPPPTLQLPPAPPPPPPAAAAADDSLPLNHVVHLGAALNETASLSDGSTVHRLAVRGPPGCAWLSARLEALALRPGERLFVHGERGVGAQGAWTAESLRRTGRSAVEGGARAGTLVTPPLPGSLLVIELHSPAAAAAAAPRPPPVLASIVAGTAPIFGTAALEARDADAYSAPAADESAGDGPLGLWRSLFGRSSVGGPPPSLLARGASGLLPFLRLPFLEVGGPGAEEEVGEEEEGSRPLPSDRRRLAGRLSASNATFSFAGDDARAEGPLAAAVGAGGACMVDVACVPEWEEAARGVVALLIDGGLCTGSLLNEKSRQPSDPPLLLTGFHCVRSFVERSVRRGVPEGAAGSFVEASVIYNWRSPGCASPQPPAPWRGGGLQASYGARSCTLPTPPAPLPTPTPSAPASTASIHHPSGDLQKIAISFSSPERSLFCPGCCDEDGGRTSPDQRCWRTDEWKDGLVIGQMHGGYATCAHPRDDFFGQLALAYNNTKRYEQPAAAAALWPHIDPRPSGSLRLKGAAASPSEERTEPPPSLRMWSSAYAANHRLVLREGAYFAAPVHLALSARPTAPVNVSLVALAADGGAGGAPTVQVEVEPRSVTFHPDTWYAPAKFALRVRKAAPTAHSAAPPERTVTELAEGLTSLLGATQMQLAAPAVVAFAGALPYAELSEPTGCPSYSEHPLATYVGRGIPTALLLPAGRYLLRGRGGETWSRKLAPPAACDAVWRAARPFALTCGGQLSSGDVAALTRGYNELMAHDDAARDFRSRPRVPEWVSGGAGRTTPPPLVDMDGDGRADLVLRFSLPEGASLFQIDSCGSEQDMRLRLYRGCPWGAGQPAGEPLSPLLADGDSATLKACRDPLAAAAGAGGGGGGGRRLAGLDGFLSSAALNGSEPLAPGDYWLVLDSDAEEAGFDGQWQLRAQCASSDGEPLTSPTPAGALSARGLPVASPCDLPEGGGCTACTGLDRCGWCADADGYGGACVVGVVDGPLLAACGGDRVWQPFEDSCGVPPSPSPWPEDQEVSPWAWRSASEPAPVAANGSAGAAPWAAGLAAFAALALARRQRRRGTARPMV
ncbi:hypothetical protein EMIHUDRAFT_467542 [Emiliania huxleyi CCMP1516]|uniref:Peptidase S1 domain-containing protein n=3 Tax=Emiliania huxleyi TaxID=2903 RepID=A0A0D3KG69_EMIH1|nr:hypothetical protein EMIHUDRAFT_467542 [Emiliania huxleyi CCMP1516]EOD34754.1 hypothetical protein EMIHUDRAFT_467542 [Emiliania huxleyi CCMP1516]|eukprot:XP_005787183.1 hypothetical protein EMIHUDRAFT_467542 [Emiliania huxleyi CCMP1516]